MHRDGTRGTLTTGDVVALGPRETAWLAMRQLQATVEWVNPEATPYPTVRVVGLREGPFPTYPWRWAEAAE